MKMIASLVICFIISSVVQSQNVPPSITISTPNNAVYYNPGLIGTLPCSATGSAPIGYVWQRNGKDVNPNDNRYNLVNGALTIKAMLPELEGYYQCFASNSFGKAMSNSTLVLTNTLLPGNSLVSMENAYVGSSYVIHCPVPASTSQPTPKFVWQTVTSTSDTNANDVKLDKRVQVTDDGNLTFSYLRKEDSQGVKIYRCHLVNPNNNALETSLGYTNLTVLDASSLPTSLTPLFNYSWPMYALVNNAVVLRCFFAGAEGITISWTKPDGSSPSGGNFKIDEMGNLTINVVKMSDQGTYTCQGVSGILRATATVNVIVHQMPTFQSQQDGPYDMTLTNGSTVSIDCRSQAIPEAVVQWYQNSIPFDANSLPKKNMALSSDKKTLTIMNLCKENCPGGVLPDLMVIQCNASNVHGYAFANGYLNVLDKTVITERPQDVKYHYPNQVIFRCNAVTDPKTQLTFNWLLDGKAQFDGSFNTSTNILYINMDGMSEEDARNKFLGAWTCNASNGYSYDTATALLYIPAQPYSAYVWPYWWIPFIVLLIFLAALLLICLICCCMYRNRGDGYPVDEVERKIGNDPEKELKDTGFHDYQRGASDGTDGGQIPENKVKPRRNPGSLSGSMERIGSSDDEGSLANYSNINPGKFNEEGSFIGQYNPNARQSNA